MAESYGEKIRRRFKEKRQQHMLTGGAGDANVVRKKEATTKKSVTKKPTRPYRKKGSSEALPNLKKMRELAKKIKLMSKTAMGSRTPAGTTQPRKPKAPTTLNITDTALGGRTPQKTKTPTSFAAAFKAARKRLGAGKTFTWKGKKYSTNTKADLAKKKIVSKKRIDPFAIKSKASKSGIDGGSFTSTKKKVKKPKAKFTEPVDRKKKSSKKNVMSTKDIRYYKGTNITPTKLQRDRMRKRKLAST